MYSYSANGLIESVAWLLDKGANINVRTNIFKRSPLMLAAENNHIEVALLLLRRGAMLTINDVDIDGRAALHFAATKASIEMAQVNEVVNN
jgi:ankyrin repeat protein